MDAAASGTSSASRAADSSFATVDFDRSSLTQIKSIFILHVVTAHKSYFIALVDTVRLHTVVFYGHAEIRLHLFGGGLVLVHIAHPPHRMPLNHITAAPKKQTSANGPTIDN